MTTDQPVTAKDDTGYIMLVLPMTIDKLLPTRSLSGRR